MNSEELKSTSTKVLYRSIPEDIGDRRRTKRLEGSPRNQAVEKGDVNDCENYKE